MSHWSAMNHQDVLVAEAVEQYFDALDRGESPSLEGLLDRYPDVQDILREVIPALRIAEGWPCDSSGGGDRKLGLLGDFRILRQLGRGGMGVVYEAEQISMRRRVALKVLPLAGLVGELNLRRFHNEVRAAATLEHPHIVSVYTVGEERGVHYYAMQLIRGQNLSQVIESLRSSRKPGRQRGSESAGQVSSAGNNGRDDEVNVMPSTNGDVPAEVGVDPEDTIARAADSTLSKAKPDEYFRHVAALGVQAAEALHYAHSQGIVHRDIKPANLLLDRSANLYVADFGLARIEADAGMTLTGDVIGTLRYMAPEQALPDGIVVDHLADVYSLGVTLYELLSLQPAYPANDRQQLLKLIAFEEPRPLRRLDREIPQELDLIVRKAISKDRDERYPSARELADDLRLFLENRPIKAKRPTLVQVTTKWTRRNPALTWAAVITLVFVTMASAVSVLLIAAQRNSAVAARNTAVAATNALDDELYASQISAACSAWSEPNLRRVQELLYRQIPRDGEKDRRGPAWSLLASLCKANRGELVLIKDSKSDWCLSPDRQRIAAVIDSNVVVWDLASQEQNVIAKNAKRPDEWLVGIEFSQDGKRLAFAGSDGIQVVDLSTGEVLRVAEGRAQRQIALSPDGNWVANVSHQGAVEIWDAHTGNPAWSQRRYLPTSSASRAKMIAEFSPDSQRLVTVAGDGTESEREAFVSVWSVGTGEPVNIPIKGAFQHYNYAGMFIDNESFLLSNKGRNVYLVRLSQETQPGLPMLRIPRTKLVQTFDLKERRFALGTDDNKVEVWDIEEGELLWHKTCTHRVTRVHFLNDRQLILSFNDRVETCDLEAKSITELPIDKFGWPFCLAVHNDNMAWRGASPGEVTIWDAANGDIRPLQIDSSTRINSIAFSPDGTILAIADEAAGVWTCDAVSGDILRRYQADAAQYCLAFSPDGTKLAGGSDKLTYWDVDQSAPKWNGPCRSETLRVEFSPDGERIIAAGRSLDFRGYVAVWNVSGEAPISDGDFYHPERVRSISVSTDGRWLAAGDDAKRIVVYDLRQMEPACELLEHIFSLRTLAFSPDSRVLLSSDHNPDDGVTKIWQVGSWRHLGTLRADSSPGKLRFIESPQRGFGLLARWRTRFTQRFQIQWIDDDKSTDWSWLGQER